MEVSKTSSDDLLYLSESQKQAELSRKRNLEADFFLSVLDVIHLNDPGDLDSLKAEAGEKND